MNKQHRLNLLKLADYIEHQVSDEEFSMEHYWSDCGTVGCLLGHAVFAGIAPGEEFLSSTYTNRDSDSVPLEEKGFAFKWMRLGESLFGLGLGSNKKETALWMFLFSWNWARLRMRKSITQREEAIKRLHLVAYTTETIDENMSLRGTYLLLANSNKEPYKFD